MVTDSHSVAHRHVQIVTEYEAVRRLQALEECSDAVVVQQDAELTKTTRRPAVVNVICDVDELSGWSAAVNSRDNADQLIHVGKTSRLRLNAEV